MRHFYGVRKRYDNERIASDFYTNQTFSPRASRNHFAGHSSYIYRCYNAIVINELLNVVVLCMYIDTALKRTSREICPSSHSMCCDSHVVVNCARNRPGRNRHLCFGGTFARVICVRVHKHVSATVNFTKPTCRQLYNSEIRSSYDAKKHAKCVRHIYIELTAKNSHGKGQSPRYKI